MLRVKLRAVDVVRNKNCPHSEIVIIRKRTQHLQKCVIVVKKGHKLGERCPHARLTGLVRLSSTAHFYEILFLP